MNTQGIAAGNFYNVDGYILHVHAVQNGKVYYTSKSPTGNMIKTAMPIEKFLVRISQ